MRNLFVALLLTVMLAGCGKDRGPAAPVDHRPKSEDVLKIVQGRMDSVFDGISKALGTDLAGLVSVADLDRLDVITLGNGLYEIETSYWLRYEKALDDFDGIARQFLAQALGPFERGHQVEGSALILVERVDSGWTILEYQEAGQSGSREASHQDSQG